MDVVCRARQSSSPTSTNSDSHEQDERRPSQWIIEAARKEFNTPAQDRINTSTHGSVLIRFRSPAAHRLQLRSTSSAIWFPEDMCLGLGEAFSFMTTQAPTTPSLALALDTSCLIHVGLERGDTRMVLAGRKMYVDTLRFLRVELGMPTHRRADALLATMMVLQVTEAATCMGAADWRAHSAGVAAFLRDRGRVAKETHPGWSKVREHQFLTFQLWDALIARRELGQLLEDAPALLLSAQKVPGLLADVDNIRWAAYESEGACALMRRLKATETELVEWAKAWNRCIRDARFSLVKYQSLPFPKRRPASAKQRPVFPHVFHFNELTDCLDHIIFSASMLSVKRALVDLLGAGETFNDDALAREVDLPSLSVLENAATACADTLCMGLPYLCEKRHGRLSKTVGASALILAMQWYGHFTKTKESHKAALKLIWCRDAAATIQSEGIRILG